MSLDNFENKSAHSQPLDIPLENLDSESVMNKYRKAKQSGDAEQIRLAEKNADEKYLLKKHKRRSVISKVSDFLPIIGSSKMILEGMTGEQMGTKKILEGWRRAVHGVSGAAFLAADLTGIGAVGSIVGKGLIRGGIKLRERSLEKNVLKEESIKLAERGHKRVDIANNIENDNRNE